MRHEMKIKVYYEDTDAGGVVYHANYLRFMERGRTESLTELGHSPESYHKQEQYFVVTRADVRFRKPARLGDVITVRTEVGEIRKASFLLRQHCMLGKTILAEGDITIAFVDSDGRPRRFPDGLVKSLGPQG
jgi:acyl-CoA thioester hydrolase